MVDDVGSAVASLRGVEGRDVGGGTDGIGQLEALLAHSSTVGHALSANGALAAQVGPMQLRGHEALCPRKCVCVGVGACTLWCASSHPNHSMHACSLYTHANCRMHWHACSLMLITLNTTSGAL